MRPEQILDLTQLILQLWLISFHSIFLNVLTSLSKHKDRGLISNYDVNETKHKWLHISEHFTKVPDLYHHLGHMDSDLLNKNPSGLVP